MTEKFCVEVMTKDFGVVVEAKFLVERGKLGEQVADVAAIAPGVACTISRVPDDAPITPFWPEFLAGLTKHLCGPRIDLPNPSKNDPTGQQSARLRAAWFAQNIGGRVEAFPGSYAVYQKDATTPSLIVQFETEAVAAA
jgi:hypothetical protein